jgi:hypothetical protein
MDDLMVSNKKIIALGSSVLAFSMGVIPSLSYANEKLINCAKADGLDAIMSCIANVKGETVDKLWDTQIAPVGDGFCRKHRSAVDNDPKKGSTGLGKAYDDVISFACAGNVKADDNYFSYKYLKSADAMMQKADAINYKFMRGSGEDSVDAENKLSSLAAFLATAAGETSGNTPDSVGAPGEDTRYKKDGFYWRYEAGWLGKADCKRVTAGNDSVSGITLVVDPDYCKSHDFDQYSFVTNYMPATNMRLLTKEAAQDPQVRPDDVGPPLVKGINEYESSARMNNILTMNEAQPTYTDAYYEGTPSGTRVWDTKNSSWSWSNQPGAGKGVMSSINSLSRPSLWIGIGSIQLTKDTVAMFYGYYHQKLVDGAPINPSPISLDGFVSNNLMQNGQTQYEGALWYWNYRSNGQFPVIGSIHSNKNPACPSMATARYLVNGGCNDMDVSYVKYYKHFYSVLTGKEAKNTPFASGVVSRSEYVGGKILMTTTASIGISPAITENEPLLIILNQRSHPIFKGRIKATIVDDRTLSFDAPTGVNANTSLDITHFETVAGSLECNKDDLSGVRQLIQLCQGKPL